MSIEKLLAGIVLFLFGDLEYCGRIYEKKCIEEDRPYGTWEVYEEKGPSYKVKLKYEKGKGEFVEKILHDFTRRTLKRREGITGPIERELRHKHFKIYGEGESYQIDFSKIDSVVFSHTEWVGNGKTYSIFYLKNNKILKDVWISAPTELRGKIYNEILEQWSVFNMEVSTDPKGDVKKIIFISE